MESKIITCECCGKPYVRRHNKQKYCCNDCRMIMKAKKQHEYFKAYYRDRTKEKKYKPKPKKGLTVEQINAEAMKAGMSYGKYVAMKGL